MFTSLSDRLTAIADWLAEHESTAGRGIGLFGASTGAAAALRTAAGRPLSVQAVVSRGGRPDLAGDALSLVHQPTLLIVGEYERQFRSQPLMRTMSRTGLPSASSVVIPAISR